MNFIQKWLARQVNSVNQYNSAVFQYLGDGTVIWMPDNSEKYINEGFYLNPDVYAAIQRIIDLATVAPLNLYQIKPDQKKAYQKYKALCSGIPDGENLKQRSYYKTKSLEEVDNHKILDLLNKPNEWQTGNELLANFFGFRLATGNAYLFKAKAKVGTPQTMGLYILPSQKMKIRAGGVMAPVTKYVYEGTQDQSFEPEEIIHNRSWSLDYSYAGSHLFGVSPLRAARRSITMSNDGREAQTWMLKNIGSKGILALDPEGLKTPPTKEQLQQIKDDYNAENKGISKAGKVGVSVGKYTWHQMGMSSVDMSIIEANKWSQQDICKVYGISPVILGDLSAATDNNYKHARVSAITSAVVPLLVSVRDSLNKGLLPEFEKNGNYVLDFDLSVFSELQEDMEKAAGYLDKAWWLTPNEKREQMNYGVISDVNMDKVYMPGSLMSIEEMNAPKDIGNIPLTNDYNDEE